MKRSRPFIVAVTVALVASAIGWETTRQGELATADENGEPVSRIASADADGSVWFCPLVASTAGLDGAVLHLRSTNPSGGSSGVDRTGTVTLIGPAGEWARRTLQLGVSGSIDVPIVDLVGAADARTLPSLAATVESSDPSLLVESSLGNVGTGTTACGTRVSDTWFAPDGSTALGNNTELALFNPFPGTAVADIEFWTDRGAARPIALQGVAVPGSSLRIIELGDSVRRRDRLSTYVRVRAGRLIAATARHHQKGKADAVDATLAAPATASNWFSAINGWTKERPETFTIVNPSDVDATIEIAATLAADDVEPFEITVDANSSVEWDPSESGRIPSDQRYALVVQSANPEIVVSRRSGGDPGRATALTPLTANRWTLDTQGLAQVVVFNPYDVVAQVRVGSSAAVALDAGGYRAFAIGSGSGGGSGDSANRESEGGSASAVTVSSDIAVVVAGSVATTSSASTRLGTPAG